ncbi:MAG TPA: hypothetical protein VIG06_07360, partial [Kofleriaceae bacterium]
GVLLYREVLHVPLIVKLPGQRRAGERLAAAVGLVDVVPTVLAELGVERTPELAGQALLSGPDPAPDRHIYSETLYPRIHLGWSELRSLTGARFHYIDGPDPELFDLTADGAERRNLRDAERPVFHAWRDELRAIPLALEAATAPTSEEMARLAALGYLAASAPQGGAERLDPKQHVAVLARIQQVLQLHARGDAPRTIELCREILRQYPDLVDLYGYLASNLRRRGRLEEALSTYREAVRRSPSLLATMSVDMAKLELDLGRGEAAAALAAEAMRWDPLEARLVLAGVAAAKGDYATAEHEAQQAVGDAAAPRLPALALLARVRIQRADFDGAWQAVSLAQERVEAGVPAVPTLDATRGDLLARRGENAAAEAAFRSEISRYPHTLDAYTRLAALLASEGRTSEVVPTLSAMVEQVPAPRAFDLAARTLEALGNPAAAEEFRRRGRRAVAAS